MINFNYPCCIETIDDFPSTAGDQSAHGWSTVDSVPRYRGAGRCDRRDAPLGRDGRCDWACKTLPGMKE